jgi:16S rRNA (guanine527-N7)-methyltransferase
MDVGLDSTQVDVLLEYIRQLQRWNRSYNLTALRDPEQMLIQHLFDSLSIVAPLRELVQPQPGQEIRIVDVGSGGGLPGVVLAAVFPTCQVVCIDAVEKKVSFVRQMSGVLGLGNLQGTHARVEALAPLEARVVISRAFASLADFAKLAGRHVCPEGWLVAMKGREPQEEIKTLEQQTPWRVERIEPLLVPELDAQRCLIRMNRQGSL